MAFFKVKVGEKVYELERLTLGDGVVLKRRFGLTDLERFSTTDVETMLGLLTLAISKTDGISIEAAQVIAEGIDFDSFEALPADDEEPDPTKAGDDDEAADDPASGGSSGKRQKKPGTRN